MIETLRKEWRAQVAFLLFLVLSIWWIATQLFYQGNDNAHQLFAAVYGVMALWGAVWGMMISTKWGGMKSTFGKAIFFLSLGLLLQEFGQLAYSYYIYYLRIEVPYPSIGDIGYFGSIPCYIYGIWLLGKASGVKFLASDMQTKLIAIVQPVIVLLLGYVLFIKNYEFNWVNPLTVFLDFGYPLGEAVYMSIAIMAFIMSRRVLGGIMRSKILWILFALIIQFLSDYTFLYQARNGIWYAGGINDYMYLCAYFIMTLSLLQLNTVLNRLKEKH